MRAHFLRIIAVMLFLGFAFAAVAAAVGTPEGWGVQKEPSGQAIGHEPATEQPTAGLTLYPPDEVPVGTWLLWDFGYLGSTSAEDLEPYVSKITIVEFTINGELVPNPDQYVVIYWGGTCWFLSFRYQHPPLSPGTYSWSFRSYLTFPPIPPGWTPFVWHRNGSGEFTVVPRGRQ